MPAITEHVTTQEERDLLELPVRLGGLGLVNPARTASQEYEASVKITGPLVRQIIKKAHEPPDETEIKTLQASARREKNELLKLQCEQVRESLPSKTESAVELQSVTKFVGTVHDYTDLKLSQLTLPSQCCFNASF